MNKKLIGIGVCGVIVGGLLFGCDSSTEENVVEDNATKQEQQVEKQEQPKYEGEVVIDNEFIKMTILGESEGMFGYGYEVLIENKTDKSLLIGYNDVSVDGMMNDPFWATEVTAGKKVKSTIEWSDESITSMADLKNIEGIIHISDEETWDTLAEVELNLN